MTRDEAIKQSADYRAAAKKYAASDDARTAEFLNELADRLDARVTDTREAS